MSTVSNWAEDFDHADPTWAADPFPIWDDLRERCPVAHSDRYNGVYLPTRHEDIAAIAHDTEHFTSKIVLVSNAVVIEEGPIGPAPPITSDPPYHQYARRALANLPDQPSAGHRALERSPKRTPGWTQRSLP